MTVSYIKSGLLFVLLSLFTLTAMAKNTILVVGDSLSAAHGIAVEQGWVSLLQQRLHTQYPDYTVVNASQSGDTTSNGLSQLPALLEKNKPTIVLIELGANDGLRGLPIIVIRKNLQSMIDLISKNKAIPILIGIRLPPNYGPDYLSQFQDVFEQLAKENKVGYVPSLLKGIDENRANFQSDGIHPVAAVQPTMLDNVWLVLKPKL